MVGYIGPPLFGARGWLYPPQYGKVGWKVGARYDSSEAVKVFVGKMGDSWLEVSRRIGKLESASNNNNWIATF